MTNWIDLNYITELLVTYYAGSYGILAIAVSILFLLVLTGFGLDFRFSLVFTLPIFAAFSLAGWLTWDWVYYVVLIAAAFIYGAVLLRIMGGG